MNGSLTAEPVIVAGRLTTTDLMESYEDALDILDDSLQGLGELIRAQSRGRRLSEVNLAHLKRQCTAAAVGAAKLRKRFERFKARDLGPSSRE